MSTVETTETTTPTPHEEFVAGLRELVDFIAANPQLEVDSWDAMSLLIYCTDRDELAQWARAMGRAEKSVDGEWYRVIRQFGPHKLQAYSGRDLVCERIVVGTETVTEEVPDPEALAAVPKITQEKQRDIVEWRCDEPLLAPGGSR